MRKLLDWITLPRALLVDAVASGGMGMMLLAGAGALEGLLGLPEPFLRWVGALLLPYAALVAWAGLRASAGAARAIVWANAGWVAASVAVLFTGWLSPTALGFAFVLAQAAAVGLFAEMQITALRRAGSPA